jgi:hypothetical protein
VTAGTSPYITVLTVVLLPAVNVLTLNDNGSDQPYTYVVQDDKGCIFRKWNIIPFKPPVIGTITIHVFYVCH